MIYKAGWQRISEKVNFSQHLTGTYIFAPSMNQSKGIYFKALLLVMVFSLNTIVSFACSFSGGFHGLHHIRAASGNKDSHHDHGKSDHHGHDAAKKHQHDHPSSEESNEDCCSKNLIEIEKKDKSVVRSMELQNISFLTSFILSYSPLFSTKTVEDRTRHSWSHVRCWVPTTIQDLRIVIQSFQI